MRILEKSSNKKSMKRGTKIKRRKSIYQIDIGIDHVIEYGDEQRLIQYPLPLPNLASHERSFFQHTVLKKGVKTIYYFKEIMLFC